MNATKHNESSSDTNAATSAVAAEPGSVIDICGTTPAVSRTALRGWATTILRHLGQTLAELSIALVSDPQMRRLNRQYRHQDTPTDVLAFPLADTACPFLLGEVIISVETAARQAAERGSSTAEEIQVLLIHAILHLVGYDHEISAAAARRMRAKERQLKALPGLQSTAFQQTEGKARRGGRQDWPE